MKRDEEMNWDDAAEPPEVERVEREIVRTRQRMTGDLDALGEKLSPDNLKRQAQVAITEGAQEVVADLGDQARRTGSRLMELVTENPLPVAAATLGAIWLFRRRNRSEISGDRMARFAYTGPERRTEENEAGALGRLSNGATSVREAVSGAASAAAGRAGEVVRQTQERARGGLGRLIQEDSLMVVGAAAFAGLVLGMVLPDTPQENRLMGAPRDSVIDRAAGATREVRDAAVAAGRQVSQTVGEEMAAKGPELKRVLGAAGENIRQEVKEATGQLVEEAKLAVKKS